MIEKDSLFVIGAGLAGSEAAWAAANQDVPVILYEMRPQRQTDVHHSDKCAELVCSNSFRSDDHTANAVGVLHEELRRAGSVVMAAAEIAKTPAGGALAVDREAFADAVTERLHNHPLIEIRREEVSTWPTAAWHHVVIATGPLTSAALSAEIAKRTGEESLAFFDAIAPIVYADSVDLSKAWFQSRYDKGETEAEKRAYLNCPMNEAQYNAFIDALLSEEKTGFKDFEKKTPYFEGCLPIEVMAARGRETLRFGPLKPVGLTNPHQPGVKPHAVVQLRQDNALGTLFNIVGFQTKLKYGAQKRVFQSIPGLENAAFARLGGIHRNTFLNSPRLLDTQLRLKAEPRIRFAGQITGVEGYVESAAMGLLAGTMAAAEINGTAIAPPPEQSAMGALLRHVSGGAMAESFQPMNVNFGLFTPLDEDGRKGRNGKKARAAAYATRALARFDDWLEEISR
jgi:methylenetetrahydrofolate--tRNA-(uracil-5-)-methyltransferase